MNAWRLLLLWEIPDESEEGDLERKSIMLRGREGWCRERHQQGEHIIPLAAGFSFHLLSPLQLYFSPTRVQLICSTFIPMLKTFFQTPIPDYWAFRHVKYSSLIHDLTLADFHCVPFMHHHPMNPMYPWPMRTRSRSSTTLLFHVHGSASKINTDSKYIFLYKRPTQIWKQNDSTVFPELCKKKLALVWNSIQSFCLRM